MSSYKIKLSFTNIYLVLLTAYLCLGFFAASENYVLYINYGAIFMGLVVFFYERSGKTKNSYVQSILVAVILYAIFCFFSSSLVSASSIVRTTKGRLISTLCLAAHLFFVIAFFRDAAPVVFKRILYCIALVYVVMTFATYSISELLEGLAGEQRLGGELNGINMFGMTLAMMALFMFYMFLTDRKGRSIHFLLFAVLVVLSLTSGSRKAMLGMIVGVAMLVLLTKSSNKFGGAIKVVLILGVALYLLSVLEVTEGVFDRFSTLWTDTNENVNESDESRADMIRVAIEGWWQKPLFGNGFNTYTILTIYRGGYAHNNLAELLFNTGLVGTVLYYYPKVLILVSFFKTRCYKKDTLAAYFFSVVVILLAFDMGCVSYYYPDLNYLWWFAGTYAIGHRTRMEQEQPNEAQGA